MDMLRLRCARRWLPILCLVGAGVGLAGCTSSEPAESKRPDLRVGVLESDTAKVLNEGASQQLLLETQVRRAIEKQESMRGKPPATSAAATGAAAAKTAEPEPRAGSALQTEPSGGEQPSEPPPVIPPLAEVRLPALTNPAMADELITVDFNQVDIRIVLKTISELSGLNFLVDENVRGTVTLISPTKIRLGDVYKVMESILEVKGYAAVPAGNVVKIVPTATAVKSPMGIYVGNDASAVPENDTIRSQMVPLRYAAASDIAPVIAPMLSAADRVTVYSQTGTLLITDTGSNVRRALLVIQGLDVPGMKMETAIIHLKHASASELSVQLQEIMERDGSVSAKGQAPSGGGRGFKAMADPRTNSIIVQANAHNIRSVKELISRLDVERPVEAGNIHVLYIENAEAADIAKSLSGVLEASMKGSGGKGASVQVTSDSSTNSLIVISPPEEFAVIQGIVGKLDIPREQVLIEMRIIEVGSDTLRDIGVEWASLDPAVKEGARGFGLTDFGLRDDLQSGDLGGLALGMFKKIGDTDRVGVLLGLLKTRSGVNILSTPQILTSNHHEATIVVAENVPYVKDSRVTDSEPDTPTVIKTYDYKDVGITLKITPHVSAGGLVRLNVDSEFSKLIAGATGSSVDTPTTAKRQAKTTVAVMNGATVVIGGLIRDDKVTSVSQVPILSDIPLIGALFRRDHTSIQKTNLLLFITPHILSQQGTVVAAPGNATTPVGVR